MNKGVNMKVLIISANDCRIPPIYPEGPFFIAKQIEAKHQVKIISVEFYGFQGIKTYINDFKPDLIMVSIRNIMNFNEETKKIVDYIKSLKFPYLVGGPAISVFQNHARNFLDVPKDRIFIGEFESQISKIFPDIKNIYDMVKIKIPDGSFLHYTDKKILEKNRVFGIDCKRGCPFKCIYCSYPYLSGSFFRKRNPKSVIENIKKLVKIGINNFFFSDSIFNVPKDYSLKICELIAKEKINANFGAFINPKGVGKEEAKIWKKINMKVELGVDSLSNKSLKIWNKPFVMKDVMRAINLFKKWGVDFNIYLMFGGPTQTVNDIKKELEKINPPFVEITVGPTIYPITKLWKIAVKESIIKPNENLLPAKTYISPSIDRQKLQDLFEQKALDYKRRKWGIIFNQYTSNPTLARLSMHG